MRHHRHHLAEGDFQFFVRNIIAVDDSANERQHSWIVRDAWSRRQRMMKDLRRKDKGRLAQLRMHLSGRNVEAEADQRVQRTKNQASPARDGISSEKPRMSGGDVGKSVASNRVLRDLGSAASTTDVRWTNQLPITESCANATPQ